jgi:hypothetical protein
VQQTAYTALTASPTDCVLALPFTCTIRTSGSNPTWDICHSDFRGFAQSLQVGRGIASRLAHYHSDILPNPLVTFTLQMTVHSTPQSKSEHSSVGVKWGCNTKTVCCSKTRLHICVQHVVILQQVCRNWSPLFSSAVRTAMPLHYKQRLIQTVWTITL